MVRKIIRWPNELLRAHMAEVEFRDDWLFRDFFKGHVLNLQQALAEVPNGLALASNQLTVAGDDCHWRVFVHDGRAGFILPRVVSNPRWTPVEEAGQSMAEEGCLSVPELRLPVQRWTKLDVDFQYEDGAPGHKTVEGLEARMVQHECDHLDGKLLVDVLPKNAQVKLRMQAIKNRKAGK